MRIHVGCELHFEFPQTTPMIATLNVHFSRAPELERPDYLMTSPSVPIEGYRDSFGNWCNRLVAPAGRFSLGTDAIIGDPGMSDPIDLNALQHQVQHLPAEIILFLLGSRYCETDRLSDEAWRLFGHTSLGWPRVQAICDFVHNYLIFDGYITDIGLPPPYAPMDFSAWIEVYLGDRWYAFDPRNNASRIGRILIAQGRDAADVPLTHIFGPGTLSDFRVWAAKCLQTFN
jgi:transglutaminase-like putative cysteine protease